MKNIWILFCVGVISFVDIVPATLSTWQDRVVRNPTNYKALYNLGVAACHEGDYEQADKAWDCVLQLPQVQKLTHQHKEELFYNAGNVAVLCKKYDKGREYFEKVVACNPQHEKAQQKLAYLRQLEEEESSSNKENENTSADDHQDTGDQEEQEKSGEEGKSSSTSSDNKQGTKESDSQQEKSNENKDQASSSDSGETDATKEHSSSAGKEEKMSSDSQQSEQEHTRDEETTEQESAAGAQEAGQQQAKNQKQTEENHDAIDSHTAKTAAEQAGHDQNISQQDSQAMGAQNNVSEPDLSAYEKDLMAALESYDKNMHKHYMEDKISGMAGSNVEHNW